MLWTLNVVSQNYTLFVHNINQLKQIPRITLKKLNDPSEHGIVGIRDSQPFFIVGSMSHEPQKCCIVWDNYAVWRIEKVETEWKVSFTHTGPEKNHQHLPQKSSLLGFGQYTTYCLLRFWDTPVAIKGIWRLLSHISPWNGRKNVYFT